MKKPHVLVQFYRRVKAAKGHEAAIKATRRLYHARYDWHEDDAPVKPEENKEETEQNDAQGD